MKKLHFLLSTMLVAMLMAVNPVQADNIDLQKAKQLGAYYLGVQSGAKSMTEADLTLVYQIPNVDQNIPALYFFNSSNGGSIVMSGSDCVSPVISYSSEEPIEIDHMAPAMLWYYLEFAKQVVAAQNANLTAKAEVSAEWKDLENHRVAAPSGAKSIYNTIKSVWGQDYPYNNLCPTIRDTHCVTGCVATAMAQIVKYWEYPTSGTGTIKYYWDEGYTYLKMKLDTVTFNYDKMPDTAFRGYYYTCNWTDEQIYETAKLNYACGLVNHMGYGIDGSGAAGRVYTKDAFTTYFKYDASTIKAAERSSKTDEQWKEMLKTELKNKRPVYYTAADPTSAGGDARHAFIITGYNTDNDRVRVNWGWDGSGNSTWFKIMEYQLNQSGYYFTDEHYAIWGIKPPSTEIRDMETVEEEAMPAYPNPAHTWVSIPYVLNGANSALLQIFSVDGRMMEQREVFANADKANINVESYPKGIYVYRINGKASKFVVE